jgi:hypothetical protein
VKANNTFLVPCVGPIGFDGEKNSSSWALLNLRSNHHTQLRTTEKVEGLIAISIDFKISPYNTKKPFCRTFKNLYLMNAPTAL